MGNNFSYADLLSIWVQFFVLICLVYPTLINTKVKIDNI